MREFTTAVKEANEEGTPEEGIVEFVLDGRTMHAHRPTEGQLAMLMVAMGKHTDTYSKIAGAIDFFVAVMDETDRSYLVDRLLSRDDPLDIEMVVDIMRFIMEEWSGRPTKSPSASTQ